MRVVLKISGESLKGEEYDLDNNALELVLKDIKSIISEGAELIVVPGGGNFWRGRNELNISNSTSDYVGMLATVMNAIAIDSFLKENGISSAVYGSMDITGVIKKGTVYQIEQDLKDKKVVIFGGGLGIPSLTTDMTTVSKAIEHKADMILMAKNIDAIYDRNPKEEGAKKLKEISHEDLLAMSIKQGVSSLMIMDIEALSALSKHHVPLYVYSSKNVKDLKDVLQNKEGTRVITKETV